MKGTLIAIVAAMSAFAVPGAGDANEMASSSGPAVGQTAPLTLTIRATRYGRILFDGRKRVLYGFTRDRRGGPSRCYGACAKAWPVYFDRGTVVRVGPGVRKSLIGKTRRRDGRRQFTYNGWPLYYYAHEGPGEVRCQNVDQFGGLWLVVRPNGALVR